MKFIKFIFIAATAMLLSMNSYAQNSRHLGKIIKNLDKTKFEQSLTNAVAPNVMGYQYVLIKDGKIVSEQYGGKARNGSDGDMKMVNATPINIGSLQKFITGTAMISLFEKPTQHVDLSYKNGSLKQNLQRPIWGEFPKTWLSLIPGPEQSGKTVRYIKFMQLLQHRSGFDDDYRKGLERSVVGYLAEGFTPAQFDKREYANINFVMAGYLLPLIETHNLNYDLDQETFKLSTQNADILIRNELGKRLDKFLTDRFFNKMTPKINPSCDAKNELKNYAAYGYDSKNDTAGILTSQIEKKGHCSGEGGYYMSARDFANYVAHFSSTNLIVSDEARDLMFNDEMKNTDDRLVWNSATADSWMKEKFNMPVVAWSDGSTNGTKTVLLRLPQNHYLVIFANSEEMNHRALYAAGIAAFKEGMKHNFE